MSEISALRFLSERSEDKRDYLVATTKLINGAGFVESLIEQVANKLNGGTGVAGGGATMAMPYAAQTQATKTGATTAAAAAAPPQLGKR